MSSIAITLALISTMVVATTSRYVDDQELEKPSLNVQQMIAHPIDNQMSGVFNVVGVKVTAPKVDSGLVTLTMQASIDSSEVRDATTNHRYRVIILADSLYSESGMYTLRLQLTGGIFPLHRGKVKGFADVMIYAKAEWNGMSSQTIVTKRVAISN